MNNLYVKTGLLALSFGLLFTGCSKDKDGPNPENPQDPQDQYVLITMSESNLTKPGFATVFDALPTGEVSNNGDNSMQGLGFGGWRPYENWILKMFSTDANAHGIERLEVGVDGKLAAAHFIAADDVNGSGNFVIENETSGFYWDGAEPLHIQTFNPTTMQRTGALDLTQAADERGEGIADIKFRSVGQKFLAVKEGKLFANVSYATTDGPQKGFWDDYFPDVYIAVIDIASGTYEKTIKIEETGAIAYVNDNPMYDFDTNGDLYIVTQGVSPQGVGGKSKISRIKSGETDIDPNWSLDMDDINPNGKFITVFARDGKLITLIPNEPLMGGPNGNINFSDVWDFYSIDVASGERTKISGVPSVINPGAALATIEIDGKTLLRVSTASGQINGYYLLEGTQASPFLQVTSGGSVSGLYKLSAE